jgi:hypothetical protein
MMTPMTTALILPRVLRLGGLIPRVQVARSVATGVVACDGNVRVQLEKGYKEEGRLHLQHLDK